MECNDDGNGNGNGTGNGDGPLAASAIASSAPQPRSHTQPHAANRRPADLLPNLQSQSSGPRPTTALTFPTTDNVSRSHLDFCALQSAKDELTIMSFRPGARIFHAFRPIFRQQRNQSTAAPGEQSGFQKLWNSPVGPKTVHFWYALFGFSSPYPFASSASSSLHLCSARDTPCLFATRPTPVSPPRQTQSRMLTNCHTGLPS